jgi:hypothetical protein
MSTSQERRKTYQAAYRAGHKEEHKAYRAARNAVHKEEHKAYRAAYYAAHKEEIKAHCAAYQAAHKEEIKACRAVYRAAHKEEIKARSAAYYVAHKEEIKAYDAAHKEEQSVRNHHRDIFGTKKTPPRKNYEGMPFCDAWNPKKGGSFRAGGDWIKANLVRPSGKVSLHVVDHAKGFVPGNLEWTHPTKQNAEQMFKIIARQKHQINQQVEYIRFLKEQIEQVQCRAQAA